MNKKVKKSYSKVIAVLFVVVLFTNFSVSKASVVIGTVGNGTYMDYANDPTDAYGLDFNNDGQLEFTLNAGFLFSNTEAVCSNCYLIFNTNNGVNNVWTKGTADGGWDLVQSHNANVLVGSTGNFIAYGDANLIDNANNDEPLLPLNQDSYVAFRFQINGNTHYGWAKVRMTGDATNGYNAEWIQCAYENTPNASINNGSTGVGINENNALSYRIYPNPVVDVVTIEAANVNSISVFDIAGRQVSFNTSIDNNCCVIDLSNLKSGIYFIRMNNLQNAEMMKIIKQ